MGSLAEWIIGGMNFSDTYFIYWNKLSQPDYKYFFLYSKNTDEIQRGFYKVFEYFFLSQTKLLNKNVVSKKNGKSFLRNQRTRKQNLP